MAVNVTIKRGVHDLTPRVETFDGADDEYWFETEGKQRVLKVYRSADETTKTYAEGQWLTVEGKERLPVSADRLTCTRLGPPVGGDN